MVRKQDCRGITRTEVAVLVFIIVCLATILVPLFADKKRGAELVIASSNVQTLYQNQVLQYFASKRFLYSLTRINSWPDFLSARPPSGIAEQLVGLTDENATSLQLEYKFVEWDAVGFPLTKPSHFLYRIEPEPAYANEAKVGKSHGNPYHFHVVAIGDLDGDGKPSVMLRAGYVDKNDLFHGMERLETTDILE